MSALSPLVLAVMVAISSDLHAMTFKTRLLPGPD
jgi:hypothetical protein